MFAYWVGQGEVSYEEMRQFLYTINDWKILFLIAEPGAFAQIRHNLSSMASKLDPFAGVGKTELSPIEHGGRFARCI